MRDPLIAPADAHAPDADPGAPDVPANSPDWFVHFLALLILFLLENLLAVCSRRSGPLPSRWKDRSDLPPGSAQAEAASIRGSFGTPIAGMCRRNGVARRHPHWPELSRAIVAFGGSLEGILNGARAVQPRAIVAFGGSLEGFRADAPPCRLQLWENPACVPGMIGFAPAAATATLPQHAVADIPRPASNAIPAETAHVLLPASWSSEVRRQVFARAGPGPPTGPHAVRTANTVMFAARGRSTASPAVLIRADRNFRSWPRSARTFNSFGLPG